MAQHGTTWHQMTQRGLARPGDRTWWRLHAELAQCRETPMQKHCRQPSGLAALRWKVPAAQASHSRPRTLGCRGEHRMSAGGGGARGWRNGCCGGSDQLGAGGTGKWGARVGRWVLRRGGGRWGVEMEVGGVGLGAGGGLEWVPWGESDWELWGRVGMDAMGWGGEWVPWWGQNGCPRDWTGCHGVSGWVLMGGMGAREDWTGYPRHWTQCHGGFRIGAMGDQTGCHSWDYIGCPRDHTGCFRDQIRCCGRWEHPVPPPPAPCPHLAAARPAGLILAPTGVALDELLACGQRG